MNTIPQSLDRDMDKAIGKADRAMAPGVSIRYGPVDEMDVDEAPAETNGHVTGKRKSRPSVTNGKSYKEQSSEDEDDKPLVCS